MFDKATRIEIIFNDNEYIVSNPDEIEQIIRLCRQNWEPSNTHITKQISHRDTLHQSTNTHRQAAAKL